MQTLRNLSLKQLHQIIKLRERISALERKLEKVLPGSASVANGTARGAGRKAGGRRRKRKMSAAHRAKLATAAKARWKKAKAAGKSRL
jgi:hypothetical protein